MTQVIPKYKSYYSSSVGVLYRPLQEVEIYVEDDGSEVFYTELFGRLLKDEIKIKKIIPLGCRLKVLEGVKKHDHSFPKVFIIDGDLFWVSQQFKVDDKRLYQYDFYCIENALFCKQASIALIQETLGTKTTEQIEKDLDWDNWISSIEEHLVRLFITFATAFKLKPTIPTVSRGFESIITRVKRSAPIFAIEKIDSIIIEIQTELYKSFSEKEVKYTQDEIESWIKINNHGINIVSGKDFLLPLLGFKIKEKCGLDMKTESRNFRLARLCNLAPLQDLKDFVINEVKEQKNKIIKTHNNNNNIDSCITNSGAA